MWTFENEHTTCLVVVLNKSFSMQADLTLMLWTLLVGPEVSIQGSTVEFLCPSGGH